VNRGAGLDVVGPSRGGLIQDLPLFSGGTARSSNCIGPSEAQIPLPRSIELSNLGFVPLVSYAHRSAACFFTSQSANRPKIYDDDVATEKEGLLSRLPYQLLMSQLVHSAVTVVRDGAGWDRAPEDLENTLQAWLQALVTEDASPGPASRLSYPLADATVSVNLEPVTGPLAELAVEDQHPRNDQADDPHGTGSVDSAPRRDSWEVTFRVRLHGQVGAAPPILTTSFRVPMR
jgi:predicted component of type VI protein secretion system